MAFVHCMQFVLHADLILFAVFCRVVSGRTFSSMNGRILEKLCINTYFLKFVSHGPHQSLGLHISLILSI
jgi:hypothetical protein